MECGEVGVEVLSSVLHSGTRLKVNDVKTTTGLHIDNAKIELRLSNWYQILTHDFPRIRNHLFPTPSKVKICTIPSLSSSPNKPSLSPPVVPRPYHPIISVDCLEKHH